MLRECSPRVTCHMGSITIYIPVHSGQVGHSWSGWSLLVIIKNIFFVMLSSIRLLSLSKYHENDLIRHSLLQSDQHSL